MPKPNPGREYIVFFITTKIKDKVDLVYLGRLETQVRYTCSLKICGNIILQLYGSSNKSEMDRLGRIFMFLLRSHEKVIATMYKKHHFLSYIFYTL